MLQQTRRGTTERQTNASFHPIARDRDMPPTMMESEVMMLPRLAPLMLVSCVVSSARKAVNAPDELIPTSKKPMSWRRMYRIVSRFTRRTKASAVKAKRTDWMAYAARETRPSMSSMRDQKLESWRTCHLLEPGSSIWLSVVSCLAKKTAEYWLVSALGLHRTRV